jgi:transposase InsO family protein
MALLRRQQPDKPWPADSTASELLKRYGLVRPRRRRRTVGPYELPFQDCNAPNDVWAIDFKGDFRLGNGHKCIPLTLEDSYSRMALRAEGLSRGNEKTVRPILESVFDQYGLPKAIRSDNGPPFATTAPAGLSRLSIWWLKLGIRPERIEPGKPQQNGRIERFHRTLLDEAITPPAAAMTSQQNAFDRFRAQYNEIRPHEALGQRPPVEFYECSKRRYPCPLKTFDYDDGELRKVRRDGTIKWLGRCPYISETLRGEIVCLSPVEPDMWLVRFGPLRLGHLHPNKLFRRIPISQSHKPTQPPVSPM